MAMVQNGEELILS